MRFGEADGSDVNISQAGASAGFPMPDAPTRIIRVGDNAWQSVRSGNLALLVDGENYYQRLEEVLTTLGLVCD